MLQRLSDLKAMTVNAMDGPIGRVRDVYFDDYDWTMRYLLVDTDRCEPRRAVLLAPTSIRSIWWDENRINVCVIRDQVRHSPGVPGSGAISRQDERNFCDHYGYSYYWRDAQPGTARFLHSFAGFCRWLARSSPQERGSRLCGVNAVDGCRVAARDGDIGCVQDVLFSADEWLVRYFVINIDRSPGRKRVVAATQCVQLVNWQCQEARLNLTLEAIDSGPEYGPDMILTANDEERLRQHYARVAASR